MKIKTQYICQTCGQSSPKWLGRCAGCGEWNTLVEERVTPAAEVKEGSLSALRDEFRGRPAGREDAETPAATGFQHRAWVPSGDGPAYVPLKSPAQEGSAENAAAPDRSAGGMRRITTGMRELDRVLGGGLVRDSFILLGGDPGIGKSTLLLQMAKGVGAQATVLYVSGEESIEQIRDRAHRLGVDGERIYLASETQLERVFDTIKELRPDVLVMDSIQTFATGYMQSAPGSVGQIREVAARLMTLAKTAGIAVWLVGHVTKEGNIAGPKVVEHMVDTVLYFEGDGGAMYRLLRAVKNRFGSSRELGVFEMAGEGLQEVANPSSLFLNDRQEAVPGTAIAAAMEGSRPILVELQALVSESALAMPRRTAVGIEGARLSLLAAILERHMGLRMGQQDLFFNVAGGLKLGEPACDLPAAAAIWSSVRSVPIPPDWVLIGEVGLTGEVRRVPQIEGRLEEAAKLGFRTAVIPLGVPKAVMDRLKKSSSGGLKILTVARIGDLPRLLSES